MVGNNQCQVEREILESLVIQRRERRTWLKKGVMVVIILGTIERTILITRGTRNKTIL